MQVAVSWLKAHQLYVACLIVFFLSCLSIGFDRSITDALHDATRPMNALLCIFTFLGDGRVLIPGCILFWLAMLVTGQRNARAPLIGLASVLSSGLLAQLLKMMIGRPRPYATGDLRYLHMPIDTLHGFTTNHDFASFPSGHSTAVFAVAWFVTTRLKSRTARAGVLIVAALAALSRVMLWKHYLADTVAGASVGIFMSQLTLEFFGLGTKPATAEALVEPKII